MSNIPPRFVPTLTEVVQPPDLLPDRPLIVRESLTPVIATVDSLQLENQLVHRVLQRLDLILERRLREAVGQLVLEHTETLAPQLRVEIESVVRQSVSQAVAQEVASLQPPP